MLPEEQVAASAFQQLRCLGNAHRVGNADDRMEMARHHLQPVEGDAMLLGSLPDAGFRKILMLLLPEHLVAIMLFVCA